MFRGSLRSSVVINTVSVSWAGLMRQSRSSAGAICHKMPQAAGLSYKDILTHCMIYTWEKLCLIWFLRGGVGKREIARQKCEENKVLLPSNKRSGKRKDIKITKGQVFVYLTYLTTGQIKNNLMQMENADSVVKILQAKTQVKKALWTDHIMQVTSSTLSGSLLHTITVYAFSAKQ